MIDSYINRITHEDIKKFTSNVHKLDDFVCSHQDTKKERWCDPVCIEKSRRPRFWKPVRYNCFDDLNEKIPSGEVKELHRWDYLKLYLEPSAIRSIHDLGDEPSKRPDQFKLIKKLARVVKGSQNSALRAFGYQDFETGITLQNLKNRWVSEISEKKDAGKNADFDPSTEWATDLYGDVLRAIFNKKAQRTFNYFESISIDQATFFRPAVIKAMNLMDDSMVFDVYLYRLGANEMQLIDTLRAADSNTEQ